MDKQMNGTIMDEFKNLKNNLTDMFCQAMKDNKCSSAEIEAYNTLLSDIGKVRTKYCRFFEQLESNKGKFIF